MRKIIEIYFVTVAGVFGVSQIAHAGPSMDAMPRATVVTRDLDLSTDTGVRRAHARILRAAERVCGDYPHAGSLVPTAVERCRMKAEREADVQLAARAAMSRP